MAGHNKEDWQELTGRVRERRVTCASVAGCWASQQRLAMWWWTWWVFGCVGQTKKTHILVPYWENLWYKYYLILYICSRISEIIWSGILLFCKSEQGNVGFKKSFILPSTLVFTIFVSKRLTCFATRSNGCERGLWRNFLWGENRFWLYEESGSCYIYNISISSTNTGRHR